MVYLKIAYLLVIAGVALAEPSASDLYKMGRKAEKKGDITQAYLLYAQAAAAEPRNPVYWQRSQALQSKAVLAANVMPPSTAVAPASEADLEIGAAHAGEMDEARKPQPPIELKGSGENHSFDVRGDARALIHEIAKRYGFEVVFDGDYPPTGQPIRFRLDDADFRQGLYAVMASTGSFLVPISERVFMAVKDTEQKRRDVENTVAVTVPIPDPVTIQEAQELARSVQQLMEIQRFAIDSAQRLVLMRDRMSKVWPARELLMQLMHRRTEVALEIDLMEVSKTSTLGLGISVPTTYPLVPFGDFGKSSPLIPSSFRNFLTFGGGKGLAGIGLAGAELLARMTKSEARNLFHTELRSVEGLPASFHAGDKYPIMTVGYFGDTSGGGSVFAPPPTFQFEDLGLVLKVTPKVHDMEEVTLEVEAEFKLLGGQSLNGIPVISSRRFASRVRLKFGEWAIVGGLVTSDEARTLSGLAGLVDLPFLWPLVGQKTTAKEDSQAILLIKPRLLSLPPGQSPTPPIWIGSETRPRTIL